MRALAITLQVSAVLIALTGACGRGDGRAPKPESGSLPDGIAAEVGNEQVSTALVAAIAVGQGVDPRTARDLAISDALFAAVARDRFAGSGLVESAERSALARAVLEQLRRDARAKGPPSDSEVEAVTAERWQELARPALSRTHHAVVLTKDPSDDAKAKRVAERLAASVKGVTDPKEFERRAKQVDTEGLELRVEELLPVAGDGRVGDANQPPGTAPQTFDPDFAKAAAAIPSVGDQSPPTRSKFGYHVILLTERIPESFLPLEQRRSMLTREIMDRRARASLDELVQRIANASPVAVNRAADDLMGRVRVAQ